MSEYQDFMLSLKSTLDKAGRDIATKIGIQTFVDLDDTVNAAGALQRDEPVVMWRLLTLDDAPVDPLYLAQFVIGVSTTYDASNYTLLGFNGAVKEAFKVGDSLDIYDWSKAEAPTQAEKRGYMFFTANGVDPQASEAETGYRLMSIAARVARTA
jgi:hypothetical protein